VVGEIKMYKQLKLVSHAIKNIVEAVLQLKCYKVLFFMNAENI